MASDVKGEMAVAQFRSPVEARADIAGSPREEKMRPAGSSKRATDAITPTDPTLVSAEQYLCYLSGFVWMGCGGGGICMKYSLGLSSSFISWLGSAYGPTLRLTAVACLVSGAVLVRCGLARPDMSSVSGQSEASRSVGRNRVCNGRVVSIRRTVVGSWRKWKGRA